MLCKPDCWTSRPVTSALKATAVAHPNIALVKYWGKRDDRLILPYQSSLSITLGELEVTTTVQFAAAREQVELHGEPAQGLERARITEVLDRVRSMARARQGGARVSSRGNFPSAAGLASSAAGFAALAMAARAAAGLASDVRQTSILARLGSGSACRSLQGGVCVWRRGQARDGSDSYAEQLFTEAHWPELRLVVALVGRQAKEVTSREGMQHTVATSPYYVAWVENAEGEVERAIEQIERRDLEGLGRIAERNAWRMHASALAADPPLCYLRPETLRLVLALPQERRNGLPVWFTLDAGPNPVLLTDANQLTQVQSLADALGAQETICCKMGGDAHLSEPHLF